MSLINIAVVKIEDKVELFIDIYGTQKDDSRLAACRINFEENKIQPYATDTVSSGLFTMSMEQAKELRDNLTTILGKGETE